MPGDAATESTTPTTSRARLLSIDALRGFDMFWIIGGDSLLLSLFVLIKHPWADQLRLQWEHAEWEGFRFYDLIFPLFLFLVGCVLPFSLEKFQSPSQHSGNKVGGRTEWAQAYLRIIRRVAFLFLLGLIYNGVLNFQWADLRIAGVLQRIAICYGIAALIVLHSRAMGQALVVGAILLGYWLLMALVPAPGGIAGDYSNSGNLAGYIDRTYLPGKIMKRYYGFGDNEGILSTIPAVATTLLGALAGGWLKSTAAGWTKVAGLMMAGTACIIVGLVWSIAFPIIKNLWTSSFVLVAGGCSFILLAWFYALIDVLGWRRWAFFFVVIGANAITIYAARRVIDFDLPAQFLLGGAMRLSESQVLVGSSKVILWVGTLAAEWLFLWFLFRQRIFLRA